MVQITKDAIAGKGVQLFKRRLALPGRYLVCAAAAGCVMVSRQIDDDGERRRIDRC